MNAGVMAALIALTLVGCAKPEPDAPAKENEKITFWLDTETGCEYVIYDREARYGAMGGITARLGEDGKPICHGEIPPPPPGFTPVD